MLHPGVDVGAAVGEGVIGAAEGDGVVGASVGEGVTGAFVRGTKFCPHSRK